MIKVWKKNIKLIIGIIIGGILASGITAYAVINASDIDYKNGKNVSEALDDLYSKAINRGSLNWSPTTLTTQSVQAGYYTGGILDSRGVTTEGTEWNSGYFTSVSGENSINVRFNPSKIVIYRSKDDRTIMYNASESSTTFRRYQGESFSNSDAIDANRTGLGFMSIGSETKVYIANAGDIWYWFATD